MGYESKLYIVDRNEYENFKGTAKNVYGDVIATYDLSKMGDGDFYALFTKDIDFDLTDNYLYDSKVSAEKGEDYYTMVEDNRDCYGDLCKYAEIDDVIAYLENYMTTKDYYRRVAPLLALLKGLNKEDWTNLVVVHYGY